MVTVSFAELAGITLWGMLLAIPFSLLGAVPWTVLFVLGLVLITCFICQGL